MLQFAANLASSPDEILERMRQNIARKGITRFSPSNLTLPRKFALACYGPSLLDTWERMRGQSVVSVSGAHDFLVERGIIPIYHVECDSRPHKAAFLQKPQEMTTYLIASCCHSSIFEQLQGFKIRMWHRDEGNISARIRELLLQLDPGSQLVQGGTTVGGRALNLLLRLGARKIDIHGMDCSYRGEQVWAGSHSGEIHKSRFKNKVAGKIFETSTTMYNAMVDFFDLLEYTGHRRCEYIVHGDGMLAWTLAGMGRKEVNSQKDLLNPVDRTVVKEDTSQSMVYEF